MKYLHWRMTFFVNVLIALALGAGAIVALLALSLVPIAAYVRHASRPVIEGNG